MDRSGHAVVLGGGIAGLLAARVLADAFEQVTVIERHADLAGSTGSGPHDDRPGAAPALAQVLSERARPQLERLFPDLPAELTADGAAVVVPFSKPRPTRASELGEDRGGARLQFTQRFIQRHLSRRLTPLDAIATLHGTVATAIAGGRPVGPVSAATSGRIGWRRFDRARNLPAGIVALGGSVCSFDPCYGHDFDLAVLEAAALGRILDDRHRYGDGTHSIELTRRYFRAVSQILDS
jgi:hypothetical protein